MVRLSADRWKAGVCRVSSPGDPRCEMACVQVQAKFLMQLLQV